MYMQLNNNIYGVIMWTNIETPLCAGKINIRCYILSWYVT